MDLLNQEPSRSMAATALKHQADRASEFELSVVGSEGRLDPKRQIALVEQLIAQGVSGIVIAPADSAALVPVCQQARAAGIVVVNIGTRLDAQALAGQGLDVPFVGPDHRAGARMVGDFLARQLEPGDKVALLEGSPKTAALQERKLGFEEAAKEAKLTIAASRNAGGETEPARKTVAALLTEHADLRGLLCCNDRMALGARAAVEAAGRADDVLIAGYDGIPTAVEAVQRGSMTATADPHADQLAVFGIEFARLLLQHGAEPSDKRTPVDLVARENPEDSQIPGGGPANAP